VRLRYVIESEPLGTGGGIRNAADLASGTVWVLNGDVLTDADLSAMRAFHERRARARPSSCIPCSIRAVRPRRDQADGRVERFREKPAADEPVTTNTIQCRRVPPRCRAARAHPVAPGRVD